MQFEFLKSRFVRDLLSIFLNPPRQPSGSIAHHFVPRNVSHEPEGMADFVERCGPQPAVILLLLGLRAAPVQKPGIAALPPPFVFIFMFMFLFVFALALPVAVPLVCGAVPVCLLAAPVLSPSSAATASRAEDVNAHPLQ